MSPAPPGPENPEEGVLEESALHALAVAAPSGCAGGGCLASGGSAPGRPSAEGPGRQGSAALGSGVAGVCAPLRGRVVPGRLLRGGQEQRGAGRVGVRCALPPGRGDPGRPCRHGQLGSGRPGPRVSVLLVLGARRGRRLTGRPSTKQTRASGMMKTRRRNQNRAERGPGHRHNPDGQRPERDPASAPGGQDGPRGRPQDGAKGGGGQRGPGPGRGALLGQPARGPWRVWRVCVLCACVCEVCVCAVSCVRRLRCVRCVWCGVWCVVCVVCGVCGMCGVYGVCIVYAWCVWFVYGVCVRIRMMSLSPSFFFSCLSFISFHSSLL